MIKSFRDKHVQALFETGRGDSRWQAFERIARRKLIMLDAANTLSDLKAPPNNRLEALTGDRAGQHAIRINDQYRLCFAWHAGHASEVEIVDYH